MSEFEVEVKLSATQGAILDNANIDRLTSVLRKQCGKVCALTIDISPDKQSARSSCNECSNPRKCETAVNLVPQLANALILGSDLVDPMQVEDVRKADAERMQMVVADRIPEQYQHSGTVLIGVAATVIRSSGYVRVGDDNVLFYAKPANGQTLIEPHTPVLIER